MHPLTTTSTYRHILTTSSRKNTSKKVKKRQQEKLKKKFQKHLEKGNKRCYLCTPFCYEKRAVLQETQVSLTVAKKNKKNFSKPLRGKKKDVILHPLSQTNRKNCYWKQEKIRRHVHRHIELTAHKESKKNFQVYYEKDLTIRS